MVWIKIVIKDKTVYVITADNLAANVDHMLSDSLKAGVKNGIFTIGQQPPLLFPAAVRHTVVVCAGTPPERIDPRIALQTAAMTLFDSEFQWVPARRHTAFA